VSASTPLARLLRLLELEGLDRDLFVGSPGRGRGRLFGGLVAAQSLVAVGRTVAKEAQVHSLHGYFLRPGSHEAPIRYVVDRIRDGRSFTTRRVVAHQGGEAIFNLDASFTLGEEGIAHQTPMPDAPKPDGAPDYEEVRAQALGNASLRRPPGPVEIRVCDPDVSPDRGPLEPRKRIWLRPRGPLPEDPLLHAALLVYASDRTLLSTAARPHAIPWSRRRAASLDHAMWFHRPPRFDGWILYASESPVAHAARGLVLGAMYRPEDRARIASVAQEGLIRVERARAR
jgi:acyl-CoA thioesterase-2